MTPFKKALISSTALLGGSLLAPTAALAVSCPSNVTNSTLAGVICNFDTGSSVTVSSAGNVGGITMNAYAPASSFIHNGGTIHNATGTGIVINSSSLSGGITNNGTINSGTLGVVINSSSTISGGINNSGHITSATSGTGLFIGNSSTVTGGITNSGTITGSHVDSGITIKNNSTINGGINNSGTIEASSGNALLVFASSTITGGITNSGTISSASSIGLSLANVSHVTGDIYNSGTITGGTAGISLRSDSLLAGNIANHGIISSTNTGIAVSNSSTISGAIQNSGTIRGGNTGIAVSSSATVSGGIQNSGTIRGGTYAIHIDPGSTVNNIDLFNGSRVIGAISAVNSTLNIHDFQSEGTINANTINVIGNFTAANNITVSNGVSVGNGATFTLHSGDTVTGNIAGTGGTLAIGVGNNTWGLANGTIDLSNMKLAVDVENAPLLHNGDVMQIANTVTGSSSITDNSYLWNFQLVGNDIRVVQATSNTLGLNRPDTNTYNALQIFEANNTTNATMLQVLGNLNKATTRTDAHNVLQSVEPTLNGSEFLSAQTLGDRTMDMAGQELAMLSDKGGSSSMGIDEILKGIHVWGQMFGSHANQREQGDIQGYNANSWGGVFGMDTRNISDDAVLGLAFSYGKTNANSDNSNNTSTDINSYQLTLYGDYTPVKDTFVNGMLAYGWQNIDTARYDVGGVSGLTARGGFNTNQVAARAELGKYYTYYSTMVTPSIRANYLYYTPDSYTENGAGGANLHIDGKDMNVFELGPIISLSQTYTTENGVFTPRIHGGWRYNLVGDHLDSTNSFAAGGPAFETQGIQPSRGTLDMGMSVTYLTTDHWEFTANYDFQYRSDYTNNAAFLRAVYKF